MAKFKKGNRFWEQRSTHGRGLLFENPDLLWKAACEYFEWCDANPWHKGEAIKSGDLAGTTIAVPMVRPFTLTGFILYIDASKNYWQEFKKTGHAAFLGVITRIEDVIYTQKFEGAAVGAFNANIISRELGLVDKAETKIDGTLTRTVLKIGFGDREDED